MTHRYKNVVILLCRCASQPNGVTKVVFHLFTIIRKFTRLERIMPEILRCEKKILFFVDKFANLLKSFC